MPSFLTPNSNGEDAAPGGFREFSEHGDPSRPGPYPHAGGGGQPSSGGTYKRPPPIRTTDIEEAIRLMERGQVVELTNVAAVGTLLTKLAAMAIEAKRLGTRAPSYNLCKVSVAGTNLFCASHVVTDKYPEGITRIEMPQLSGEPVPGTKADKLPRTSSDNKVDGAGHFRKYLIDHGIPIRDGQVSAASLRASQNELVGATVAGMMRATEYDPGKEPIFISRDNYVIDGHHRWAAVVGRDALDGTLGDLPMNVVRVDAPISEVLLLAKTWSKAFGIRQKGVD
ncbi:hypothetical protein BH24ACT15_BH24ACT15_33480 [soil metagenome]